MSHVVFCEKFQANAIGLDEPPFPDALGERIFQHISRGAWELWLERQTMLINEYRLNLLDEQAQQFLRTEMEKFLFTDTSEKG